jgi:L-ascorbate metabolism protein UlaG (beta-lactamase superfamily)
MEIEYKGANCIIIKTKQSLIAVDPNLSAMGLKDQVGKAAVQVVTQPEFGVTGAEALMLDGPGEYEVSNVSIKGVPAQRHIDTPDMGKKATMYRFDAGDITLAVIGHVNGPLTEEQLEELGLIDVAVVPVGGNGYTLDAHGAVQVIRQLDPKIVIPTHFADDATKYEVPQASLEDFVKELGATVGEETAKLKLKGGALPETLTLYVLSRTS